MFCEKCGKEIGDVEVCPHCEKKESKGEGLVLSGSNKKMIVGLGAAIAIIAVLVGSVKLIDGGKSALKKSIIGKELVLKSGESYIIDKKDIKSIENIKKQTDTIGGFKTEITTSDIKLETNDFDAKGQVEIVKKENTEEVFFDLMYLPVIGVAHEIIESDISGMNISLGDSGEVYVQDYELTIKSIEDGDTEEFENAKVTNVAKIVLESDIFEISAVINMDYVFDRGVWELEAYRTDEVERAYLEGAELEFSLEELLNEYNRGRLYINLIGSANIEPLISEETVTHSRTESVDLYTQKVILDLKHETPFYDLSGQVYAYYRLEDSSWVLSNVEAEPIYDFKLLGKYTGWYEVPRNWSSDLVVTNNATLEITKVDNTTGFYEGVFNVEYKVTDDEENVSVVPGSYYVVGNYTPIIDGNQDKWSMQAEKWIDQPGDVSAGNLSGIVDFGAEMFKGDILSNSDTFELTKDKK